MSVELNPGDLHEVCEGLYLYRVLNDGIDVTYIIAWKEKCGWQSTEGYDLYISKSSFMIERGNLSFHDPLSMHDEWEGVMLRQQREALLSADIPIVDLAGTAGWICFHPRPKKLSGAQHVCREHHKKIVLYAKQINAPF